MIPPTFPIVGGCKLCHSNCVSAVNLFLLPMLFSIQIFAEVGPVEKKSESIKVISETAGFIQDRVVTSREAEISNQIELLLNSKLAKKSKAEKVSDLLVEKIVFLEAENFSLQAPMMEFNSKKELMWTQLKVAKNWQALDVQLREFEALLKEKIFAKEFIRFKAESFQAVVSDLEAQSYFDQNKEKFSGLKFDNFKENIKKFLAQLGRDEKLSAWFETLRKKYKVKNLLVHNL